MFSLAVYCLSTSGSTQVVLQVLYKLLVGSLSLQRMLQTLVELLSGSPALPVEDPTPTVVNSSTVG